jgi:hypothetical protein
MQAGWSVAWAVLCSPLSCTLLEPLDALKARSPADASAVDAGSDPTLLFFDHFDSATLGPEWTFIDHVGDSSYSLTEYPHHVVIRTGTSSLHECWVNYNGCVRITRSLPDSAAIFEVWMDRVPSTFRNRDFGLLLWEDEANFARVEFWAEQDNGVFATVWAVIQGMGGQLVSSPQLILGSSAAIRVRRSGHIYDLSYSADGADWNEAGTFDVRTLQPSMIGLHNDVPTATVSQSVVFRSIEIRSQAQ